MQEGKCSPDAECFDRPERFTFEGETMNSSGRVDKDDPVSLAGCGRSGAIAKATRKSQRVFSRNRTRPESFPIGGIHAPREDIFPESGISVDWLVGGKENLVSYDYRSALSGLGESFLPENIFFLNHTPMGGSRFDGAEISLGASSLRPLTRQGDRAEGGDEGEEDSGHCESEQRASRRGR